ncbi:MAG: hypothetical protein HY720_27700 [Planctomycetes bacterium]|nr:hypothetical protein [Planctomycetota bacterium]
MARAKGSVEKRLGLLEKADRKNRERWKKIEEKIRQMLRMLESHGKKVERHGEQLAADRRSRSKARRALGRLLKRQWPGKKNSGTA